MFYPLQKREKEAIRRQFKNNALYKILKAPCQEYEAYSKDFAISAEEVFRECILIIDDIRENPQEATFDYQDIWNDRYNDYNEVSVNKDLDETRTAASIVVMLVCICLSACEVPLYNTLSMSMMRQLKEHCTFLVELQEKVLSNIYRFGEDRFQTFIKNYIDGDDFYSDEIDILLETIPQEQIAEKKELVNHNKLTIRQVLIFLDTFLNVGFTTETTNVSAYANLISLITGEDQGSVRSAMNRMKNIDYDAHEIKEEVRYLASLLEKVKMELANRRRDQIN